MAESIVALIYKEYYHKVFQYCRTRLNGDVHAAEDCTQEVFLILHKKIKKLVMLDSILPWLYAAADREVRRYRRKHPEMLDIDEIPEPAAPEWIQDSVLDILDEEDRRLAELYYGGAEKFALAKEYGMTLDALYKRMQRIREKVKAYLEDSDK